MEFLTKADFGMKIMYKTKLSGLSYVIACITFFHLDISSLVAQDMDSSEGDRLALVALYNSTDGVEWSRKSNWLSEKPMKDWDGVTVTDGRVTIIDLRVNNLNGPIPSEIGNLTKVRLLILIGNELSGNIPKEISNLTDLWLLYLYNNNLTGEIPSEIGNMETLSLLWLGKNNLTGEIPKDLGRLSNLQTLDLGSNNLTGSIPAELGNCRRLSNISLFDNNLTGEIPPDLIGLQKCVSTLALQNNDLSGPINVIGNLKKLDILQLTNNNFSGSIPAGIWNNGLLFAFLDYNQLDFIEPIDSLPAKAKVKLNGNKIGFASITPYVNKFQSYNNQIIDGRDTLIGTKTRSYSSHYK